MKKSFALLLAILMVCTIVPSAVFAKTGEPTKTFPGDEYVNVNGSLLSYSDTNSNYHCTGNHLSDGRYYVEITNGGHSNTTAGFSSNPIVMTQGEKLHFDYWYDTELGYDWFKFKVHIQNGDDTVELQLSGENGGNDMDYWASFVYEAPTAGWYTFTWEYEKDGSNNEGSDCVRISKIYPELHWDYQRAEAMTKAGTGLFEYDFNNDSDWHFKSANSTQTGHEMYLRSDTRGMGNSVAKATLSGHTRACTLKFDYAVDCEEPSSSGTYYDYFEVLVDGESVLKRAGNYWANWYSFETELDTGWHDIEFKYVKDNSVDTSNDCAAIDNVELVYPSNDAEGRWQDINGIGSESKKVYFNTPRGAAAWGTKINSNGSGMRGFSNNRYLDDSESFCETIINMAAGETLSFDYVVCSEDWYCSFLFSVNGTNMLIEDGWADRYWHTYTYTAPDEGAYLFRWSYIKEGDGHNTGWDYAYIRNVSYNGTYNQSINLDNAITSSGSAPIHFVTDPRYGRGFSPVQIESGKDSEDNFAAMSRNQYMEYSTAQMVGEAGYLLEGSSIYFDYSVSAEAGYDLLTFKVKRNGSVVHTQTLGEAGDGSMAYYEYECPQDGDYEFVWEYSKDNSFNEGLDAAMIANVYLYSESAPLPSMDEVLNDEDTDMQLHFQSSGEYPFEVGGENPHYYVYATNAGVNSSHADLYSNVTGLHTGDQIQFYFGLISEENYDWFNFYVNGERLLHDSGELNVQVFTWTAPADGNYELHWEYTKDSTSSATDEYARLYTVKVTRNSSGMLGDVDGNGHITVTDAIMALRAAMGILTLTPSQQIRADVDGNGVIAVSDAIRILRMAMGL